MLRDGLILALERHLQKSPTSTPHEFSTQNARLTIDRRSQRTKVVIWLYDNIEMRIEGTIIVRPSLRVWHTTNGVELVY